MSYDDVTVFALSHHLNTHMFQAADGEKKFSVYNTWSSETWRLEFNSKQVWFSLLALFVPLCIVKDYAFNT